jgi:hypothetical protein
MSKLAEVVRAYPLLSLLLMAVPLFGGIASGVIGAFLGFDSLQQRVATDRQNDHVNSALDELKVPVDTIRRYELLLSHNDQNTGILKMIIRQYDQLRGAIALQPRFTGHENTNDQIAAADQIIQNIRELLGATTTLPGPHWVLIVKTAANTFKVVFAVPMRVAPNLQFVDPPRGVTPNVLEKTNIGFTVIFTPQSIPVEFPKFTADAEL